MRTLQAGSFSSIGLSERGYKREYFRFSHLITYDPGARMKEWLVRRGARRSNPCRPP